MRFCLEEMRIGFSMLRFERAVCAPLLLLLLLLLSYVMWMNEKNTRKTHKHCEERSRCVELIQFYNYNATERTYNRNESERECPERPECMNDVGLLTRSAHITFCRLLTCLLCTLRLHIAWQCALNREWVRSTYSLSPSFPFFWYFRHTKCQSRELIVNVCVCVVVYVWVSGKESKRMHTMVLGFRHRWGIWWITALSTAQTAESYEFQSNHCNNATTLKWNEKYILQCRGLWRQLKMLLQPKNWLESTRNNVCR